jgi:hypothetical protein
MQRGWTVFAAVSDCITATPFVVAVAVAVAAGVLSTGAVVTAGGLHTFQLCADG